MALASLAPQSSMIKRVISALLVLITLYGSIYTVAAQLRERRSGHYLFVQDHPAVVPDLIERSLKQVASITDDSLWDDNWPRYDEVLSWSPLPGSFSLSRFQRDCFYTNVTINAP